MITGSSALQNAPRRQTISPRIEARLMLDDYQIAGDNPATLGLSQGTLRYFLQAEHFNSKIVTIADYRGITPTWMDYNVITLTEDGASILTNLYIKSGQTAGWSSSVDGAIADDRSIRMWNSGTTLMLFYGLGRNLMLRMSSNGVSWSGTTTLLTMGASLLDIAPRSADRLYIATILGTSDNPSFRLNVAENKSSVWGSTQLSQQNFLFRHNVGYQEAWQAGYYINAYEDESDDRLTIVHKNPDPSIDNTMIASIRSDGFNLYSYHRIYEPGVSTTADNSGINGLARMMALNAGLSYAYIPISYTDVSRVKSLEDDIFVNFNVDYSLLRTSLILRSCNGLDWHANILEATGEEESSVTSFGPITNFGAVVTGRTDNVQWKYGVLGASRSSYILQGNSSVDLSDKILSYNNDNNQRISLELGNIINGNG